MEFELPKTIFFNNEFVTNGNNYSNDVSKNSRGPFAENEHHEWSIERQRCTSISASVLHYRSTPRKVLEVTFFCIEADILETPSTKEVYLYIPWEWRTRTFLLLLAKVLSEERNNVISVVRTMYGTDVCQILANTSPDNPVDMVNLMDGTRYDSMVRDGSI